MHRLLVFGVVSLAALALAGPAVAWTWPADGALLRPFSLGADPYAGGQHRGIDVAGAEGAPIRAPAAGTVTFAGSLPTYGRGVTIQTDDGYAVTLVHLGSIGVEKGASVAEGATVGTMGWSGVPEHSVPSVHLGVRRASDPDAYVDPLGLLPPRAGPAPVPGPAPTPAPIAAPAPAPAPAAPPPPAPVAPPPASVSAPQPSPPPSVPAAAPTPTPAPLPAPAPTAMSSGGVRVAPALGAVTAGTGAATLDASRGAPTTSQRARPGVVVSGGSAPASSRRVPIDASTRAERVAPARATLAATGRAGLVPALPTGGIGPAEAGGIPAAHRKAPAADAAAATPRQDASRSALTSPDAMSTPQAATRQRAVAVEPGSRGAPAEPRGLDGPGRAIRGGGAPLGPLLAAFLLGCLVAVAGIRGGARRIGGNGALLHHDADLLRELDPAHRARLHDGGRGHLRAPPAAARP